AQHAADPELRQLRDAGVPAPDGRLRPRRPGGRQAGRAARRRGVQPLRDPRDAGQPVRAVGPGGANANGARAAVRILVDADACPVKEQIYRVAARYKLPVLVVANARLRVPDQPGVSFVHIPGGLDAVDDWIAQAAEPGDIVTTADIPLAGRVVDRGAVC